MRNHTIYKLEDCLHSFITFEKFDLETRGWNQIVEEKKSFPEPVYFLNIDSRAADLLILRIKKNIFLSTTTTTTWPARVSKTAGWNQLDTSSYGSLRSYTCKSKLLNSLVKIGSLRAQCPV